MRHIRKKTWPEYFEKVLSGEKTAEIRLADFYVDVGDVLVLEEWDPFTEEYTGRKIEKVVDKKYHIMLNQFWTLSAIQELGVFLMQLKDHVPDIAEYPSKGDSSC